MKPLLRRLARPWVMWTGWYFWPESIGLCLRVIGMGAFRVLNQVMPQFLQRDVGHIVITGSLSGFRGLPGAIGYGASKAGVMALAESLYADLRRSGIKVQVVNPGFIKTRLTEKNTFHMPFLMSPEEAADHMFKHMQSTRFKRSFPTLFSWLFRFSQFWPDWLYYRVFR